MRSSDQSTSTLSRLIGQLRWAVPIILSLIGLFYVVYHAYLETPHATPHSREYLLTGVFFLSIIAPLVAFFSLSWAVRMAVRFEEAEQALRRENRQLEALNRVGETINRSLDLDEILDQALESVLEVMELTSGTIWLRDGQSLTLRLVKGVSPAFPNMDPTVPLGWCYCGQAAENGRPFATSDLRLEPNKAGIPCAKEHFRSLLSVPLQSSGQVLGVMHVASMEPNAFDGTDRELLTAIGYQLSVAVEKAQLHSQLVQLNQELESLVEARTSQLSEAKQELIIKADSLQRILDGSRRVEEMTRARIANDLHDGVRQLIVGALFETQAAREAAAVSPDAAVFQLATVERLLRQIEVEMRNAIYSLRPVTLDAHGLVSALRECLVTFERASDVTCALQVEGEPVRFDPEAELAAFRIVQEALNNVEAHANARAASVRVGFWPDEVLVEVIDDGNGFDPAAVSRLGGPGLGLLGMQERAQSIGGTIEAASGNGQGTRILLKVPLSLPVKGDPTRASGRIENLKSPGVE